MKARRFLTGISTLIVSAFVISACASTATPQSGPAAEAPKVTLTEPTATTPANVDVPGLRPQRVQNTGTVALWDYVTGATALNERVASTVLEQVRAFAEKQGLTYEPAALPAGADASAEPRGCIAGDTFKTAEELLADPTYGPTEGAHMLVACDVLLANGPTIAQRIRSVSGDNAVATSDVIQTLYANVETNEVASENELFNPVALPELMNRAAELAEMPEPADPHLVTEFKDALKDLHFQPNGSVTVTVQAGFFDEVLDADWATKTPEEQEKLSEEEFPETRDITLSIAGDAVSTFLSPLGAQVAQSASEQAPFTEKAPTGNNDYVNCELSPCVALTFDDGPFDQTTPTLLADLAEHNASATFFVLGQNAEIFPDLVKQEADAGHEVGSHSYDHPDLNTMSEEGIHDQLDRTASIIESIIGHKPTTFRPPYGNWTDQVLEIAGTPAILWSIDTNDWQKPDPGQMVAETVNSAVPGDIILMHDIHDTSVAAVPALLDGLSQRGFDFATISQLFGSDPAPGHAYYNSHQMQ